MSGLRFAADTENPGPVGSRAKPRKRRSSILKSPSRNALHDLDPNTGEERDTTSHAKKKKRLSSRRVSFANTYQVQEYLTAQQLNILEDTKVEKDDTQPFSPEKIDQQAPGNSTSVPPTLGSSSVNTVQHADISQSLQPDVSVGPGHCIRGLDILLSGPIKKQSATESFPKMLHCPEGSIAESPQGAMYPSEGTAPLPMINEDCEVPVDRHQPETNAYEGSDLKHEPQDWPGLTANPDSVGLIGPTYHCRLPVLDSFSSSYHGSLSASSADQSNFEDQIFDLHHTCNFESTRGRDHFFSVFADSGEDKPQGEPVFAESFIGSGDTLASQSPPKKQDAKSFLNSLFGNEEKQCYDETNPSKITTSHLEEHTSIFDQNAVASEMEFTTCVSNKELEGGQKKDASDFLKSLMQTDSRGSFESVGHSSFPGDDNQETRVFDQNEATGAMDFTTCISGVIKEASGVLHVSKQTFESTRSRDQSLSAFANSGDNKPPGEQVFAKKDTSSFYRSVIGSGDTPASQSPLKKQDAKSFLNSLFGNEEKQRHSETNQSKITSSGLDEHTSIFDQNAVASEMEFTTCVSKETEGCQKKEASAFLKSLMQTDSRGSFDSLGHSSFPGVYNQKTCVFDQNEATGAMDFTTCISGAIKEASGVLHVSKQPDVTVRFGEDYAANMELTQCMDDLQKKPTCSGQKPSGRLGRPLEDITRIFNGQTGGGEMDLTTCGAIADSYNRAEADSRQSNILKYKDAARDATSCLEDQPFPVSMHKNDHTRTFHREETAAGMEMTECLESKPFPLQLSENGASKDTCKDLEKTRIFHSTEATAAMEMTTCLEGQPFPLKSHDNFPSEDPSMGLRFDARLEKMRIFHQDGNAAAMEMTASLEGQPFSLNSQDNISSNSSCKTLEKTRIFHRDETTAAMEMTTCLEGRPFTLKSQENLPSILSDSSKDLQQDAEAPTFPQSNLEVDQTRLFSPNNTSCVMDMTECMDERLSTSLSGAVVKYQEIPRNETKRSPADEKTEAFYGIPFTGSPLDDDAVEFDKSQGFKPEDTAGMDFTTCVGGLLPKTDPSKETCLGEQSVVVRKATSPQKLNDEGKRHGLTLGSDKVQDDCTRRFTSTEDTARMELTTCIANEVAYAPAGAEDNLPRGGQGESTQIFTQGETAQMELTSCLGQQQPLPVPASLSSRKSQRTASQDQTSRMEITACIGGIFPIMSADSSEADHQQDKTRVFSSVDAVGMEMTQCVGGLNLPSVETGVQSENLKEHTHVFTSDDTAKMEMTSCIGGLLSQPSGISSTEAGSRELKPNHLQLPKMALTGRSAEQPVSQDQTRIFTSDNTASMDMTTCIGGVIGKGITQSGNFSSQETLPDAPDSLPDQTCLFTSDNTGKMELTTCIGGINGSCLTQKGSVDVSERCPESSQKGHSLPDSTRIFTHDETSKMEMTQCIGGIDHKAESSSSRDQREFGGDACNTTSQKVKPSGERSVEALEKSISQEGQTARAVIVEQQAHADQTRIFTSEDTAAMEITSCVDQNPALTGDNVAQESLAADGIKQETALQLSTSLPGLLLTDSQALANQVDRPSKRDSDTFTIDPASTVKASEQTTRRSDTYTLDNSSPETSAVVANPPAAIAPQRDGSSSSTSDTSKRGSSEEEEDGRDMIGELMQWGSLDSAEGIEDEHPMWVENTEDFAQLSTQAGLASITLMEKKDHTASKIVNAFPTFGNDKGQGVIPASEMLDIDDTKNPEPSRETNEAVSSPDSNLHNETPMSSSCTSEPVSMQDFLSFVTINVKKGRRSVLPAIPKLASSQTMSDLLESRFLIQPKKVLYEWAINHLSTSIDKMQDEVNEQEQRLSENNPTVVTEVQHASPEHADSLREHVESLHKACSKMSRSSFQEWRLKMISKTHQSLQCVEAEMNEILASISTSSDALDKAMEELGKYDDSLDKALKKLEQVQPPSEDQVRGFINNQKMLVNRTAEAEEIKKTTAALESESLGLKEQIELYHNELVDVREEERLIRSQVTSQDGLQDALVKLEDLHCLQLWRLRKRSDEELVFTFLQESLVFVIKLGKQMEGSGGRHKEISSLHLDSSLSADNGVSAQLAHNLIQASIDTTLLHARHPTTATLKLLLQDVSEMVGQADGVADEIDRVSYRHVVTLNGTNVTVEFSNLDAMVKFWVTFGLQPASYPCGVTSTDFKHKIGMLKEEDIEEEVCQVTPGFAHFRRLVESIDRMIERHVPCSTAI